MFCPQCGSTQSDELNYCKTCGANLAALRQVMASRDTDGGIDWTRTWVGEMMMTADEKRRRRGLSPEARRRNEIKAGVITTSAGIGVMTLLYVLMQGIIIAGGVGPEAAILSRVWIAGIIPIMVGLALIFNGMVISRKDTNAAGQDQTGQLGKPDERAYLSPADTTDLTPASTSVTEGTTEHLKVPR